MAVLRASLGNISAVQPGTAGQNNGKPTLYTRQDTFDLNK